MGVRVVAMIQSHIYTSERIQPRGHLRAPLVSLVKFDYQERVVPLPVVSDGKLYISTPGDGARSTSCYSTRDFARLWQSGPNQWSKQPRVYDEGLLVDVGDPMEGDWLAILATQTGQVERELHIHDVLNVSRNSNYLYCETYKRGVGKGSHITCYELGSFEERWSSNEHRFSEYAVSDDYVVLTDGNSNVTCRRARNGAMLWSIGPVMLGYFADESEIEARKFKGNDVFENGVLKRMLFASGEPIIFHDLVVAPMYGNRIVALDAETGALVWHKNPEYSQNITRQAYGDELYTAGGGPYIEIHDLRSGERKQLITSDKTSYREATGEEGNVWIDNFTVSETHVFATQYGPNWFFSVEKATGRVEWAFQPPKTIRPDDRPYIAEGRVYFRSLGGLYVFEGPDGYLG